MSDTESTSDTDSLRLRVVQLEELFSHQEHLVHQLNEAVVDLRRELAVVDAKCREQEGRLRSLSESQEAFRDPLDEKPPHY
ncbi:MAG: SlyX family protein [Planctomycetaceae bacterium]|nr:SlyX family protein [Planctomycetales bacterium]MCB9927695.1 SlyX family protein [Planctomycetaceae bacterium]